MTKEKSCLVTQNLIGACNWFLTAPESIIKPDKGGDGKITWKEKARTDLNNIINRVKTPFAEPAKRGYIFEQIVYNQANKNTLSGSKHFQRVCQEVKGFEFYKKGSKNLIIDGLNVYFYAKFDALKETDTGVYIKDIKTTGSYKTGKYLDGVQHEIYCYVKDAIKFDYVIAEWDKHPKIKTVHIEEYTPSHRLEEILIDKTRDCFELLKDLGLWDAYRNTYCLY